MNCKALRECIAPLLDGDLSPDEARKAARHLDSCPNCRDLYLQLQAVPLRPAPPAMLSGSDFWGPMDQALAEEAQRPPSPAARLRCWAQGEVRLSRGSAALYLLLLILALGWQWLRGGSQLSPEELVLTQPEPAADLRVLPAGTASGEARGGSGAPLHDRGAAGYDQVGTGFSPVSYAPVQQVY